LADNCISRWNTFGVLHNLQNYQFNSKKVKKCFHYQTQQLQI
jgi:hypothetical protein